MTVPQCIHIPDGSVAISGQEFDHFCDLERVLAVWQRLFRECEAEHDVRTKALQRIVEMWPGGEAAHIAAAALEDAPNATTSNPQQFSSTEERLK